MINPLRNVTANNLRFWTNPTNHKKFKMDLVMAGVAKPPEKMIVFGVKKLTDVNYNELKPVQINISKAIKTYEGSTLEKVADALGDYLTKNPDHVIVIDSNYKYAQAVIYLLPELAERVHIVEYKPLVVHAPMQIRMLIGGS